MDILHVLSCLILAFAFAFFLLVLLSSTHTPYWLLIVFFCSLSSSMADSYTPSEEASNA